jgi:hypothetical protein
MVLEKGREYPSELVSGWGDRWGSVLVMVYKLDWERGSALEYLLGRELGWGWRK